MVLQVESGKIVVGVEADFSADAGRTTGLHPAVLPHHGQTWPLLVRGGESA